MDLIKSTIEGHTAYGGATPLEGWTQSLTHLFFPHNFHVSDRILLYIAQRTPKLNFIVLNSSNEITRSGFSKAIAHWKQVKFIILGPIDGGCDVDLIGEMGKNWKMLEHLNIHIDNFVVDRDNSIVIAKNFPGLLSLGFWHSSIYKSGINTILHNCKELIFVRIEGCMLMDEKNGSRKKAGIRDFIEWSAMKVRFKVPT
ncbi:hypothetical protein F0562_010241 [Nyssa sinensis]|uniref:Uncharacterized protein n=1 Tax=Nyssa sinensis TaxID=561372 RepID=A0A5J5A1G2_9ASTE|nr:hypothetical protein F0562_010241 [Nyssa sinensis]